MTDFSDDACRVRAVAALDLADAPPEAEFEALAALAAQLLDCPIGLLTLIDQDTLWIAGSSGNDLRQTPRSESFCTHTIRSTEALIVDDVTADPRFAELPLVTGPSALRAYAGVAISARDPGTGRVLPVGAVCALDTDTRSFQPRHRDALVHLREVADALLAARMLRRQAEAQARQLERSDRTFRQAERLAQMGSWRMDLDDGALTWSDGIYGIYDLPIGTPPTREVALSCLPEPGHTLARKSLATLQETGTPFDHEIDLISAMGVRRRIRVVGELKLQNGRPVSMIGILQDITARYRLEESLRRLASVDSLTDIANRAAFNAELERWTTAARNDGTPLELVLIDVDLFKQINDRHGHVVGDAVLRAFGNRLRRVHAADTFAARTGGDEFALILRGDAARHAPRLVSDLLAELKMPVESAAGIVLVSGTIGHAAFDPADDSLDAFIHRADSALYQAKRTERGSARAWEGRGASGAQ